MRKRSGVPCDTCGEPTWTPKSSGKTTARHKACKPAAQPKLTLVPPAPADPKAPAPRATRSVTDAARNGTTRELLEATRDRIALAVEDVTTPPRDLAALSKRLMETVREIESIDAREKETETHEEVHDEEFDAAAI